MADSVCLGEIAAAARGVTLLDQPIDLLDGHRGRGFFRLPERQDPQHTVKPLERRLHHRHIVCTELAGVHGGIERPHQVEHGGERAGRVEIRRHRVGELRLRFLDLRRHCGVRARNGHPVEPRQEVGQAAQGLLHLGEARPGEVQLFSVVRRQEQVPHRRGPVAPCGQIGQREGVPERLRHLLVVDEQVLDVHPEARELPASRTFGLRDLVLVVRENKVDAACVDVHRRVAEEAERHRRALEVPARSARRIHQVPRRLARLPRFPQHEVARVFLRVRVRVHAGARLDAIAIEAREATVLG